MDSEEVNQLITDEVDKVSNSQHKQFLREILKFERGKLDKNNYEYKDNYKALIKEYMGDEESN